MGFDRVDRHITPWLKRSSNRARLRMGDRSRSGKIFGRCFILPSSLCGLIEEVWLRVDQLEAQAFVAPPPDMDSCDLSALVTLPYGLARDAQQAHGLIHGEVAVRSFFGDAGA